MIQAPQLSRWARVRYFIAERLLKEEVAKIQMQRKTFIQTQRDITNDRLVAAEVARADRESFKQYREALTVTDLVREQLKGFNPHLLNPVSAADEDVLDSIPVSEQLTFLNQANALKENGALAHIASWLIRNQLIMTAKEAATGDQINFGRATINGVTLIVEEIERLSALHYERTKREEVFDEHDVL